METNLFNNDSDPWLADDVSQKTTAEIIFSQPPFGPYSYLVPDGLLDVVEPGMRVKVPLGRNRSVVGWITSMSFAQDSDPITAKLKPITALVDNAPLLDKSLLNLTKWISEYYLCPWGQALESSVPAGVKYQAGTKLTLFIEPTEKGLTELKERPDAIPKAQLRALQTVADSDLPLTLGDIASAAKCSFGPINELRSKGFLIGYKKRIMPPTEPPIPPALDEHLELNLQQKSALSAIVHAIHSGKPQTFLLNGVTGSGKTEVYIRAIAETLRFGRQAIVLVPEISLTPQTSKRFKSRFPRVAVLHSHLTDVERNQEWTKIANGQIDVVVGARSAIFAPLRHLGLIIIDEEHENTFKQETAPRYHAREVAQRRASLLNIPLILGTATPSLESWQKVLTKEYKLISMPKRVNNRPMPQVEVVDMCDQFVSRQQRGVVTRRLHTAIDAALRDKRQAILLLNRRGFNTQIQCPSCGEVLKCPSCDIALTYHKSDSIAICHYCDYQQPVPNDCPNCNQPGLRYYGFGTQRLESEIRTRFPNASVFRMDTDTMHGSGSHEQALSAFRRGEIDILLGTQMIAKGLDFPNVTVVGVINADTSLHLPDFRAGEKTFQLITQVAGRTGRGEFGGQVIVQTYQPDNPAIVAASRQNFLEFANGELPQRQALDYPPYTNMARIILRCEDELLAQTESQKLRQWLNEAFGLAPPEPKSEPTPPTSLFDLVEPEPQPPSALAPIVSNSFGTPIPPELKRLKILGPAPAPIYKLRDYFRFQIQIHFPDRERLLDVLRRAQEEFKPDDSVQWVIDMDPISML